MRRVPLTEQDQRVLSMVIEAGRALVLAFNKWDLVDEDRRLELDRRSTGSWHRCNGRLGSTSRRMTGRAVQKLVPALENALASWDKRISTGQLNTFLKEIVAATPPPVRGGKQPSILFATQATARPPTFVLFTSGFLEAGYRRFMERRLARDVRLRGQPDPDQCPGTGEARHPSAASDLRCDRRRWARLIHRNHRSRVGGCRFPT